MLDNIIIIMNFYIKVFYNLYIYFFYNIILNRFINLKFYITLLICLDSCINYQISTFKINTKFLMNIDRILIYKIYRFFFFFFLVIKIL